MKKVEIAVSDYVYVSELPEELITSVKRDLTLPNPEYVQRVKMDKWLGNTEPVLCLAAWRKDSFRLPRWVSRTAS